MSLLMWIGWGLLCLVQNFAFTYVSRARNSGSLIAHIKAGLASNGVWFVGQLFALSAYMGILSGHFGIATAVFAGVYYTIFTLTGSILAHYYALKTEKGKSRVGAHKDVAQFTKEEGDLIRQRGLFVDTGDGLGTFTPDELAALKELVGTKLETVDETITVSLPPLSTGYSGSGLCNVAFPPKVTGNDATACSILRTNDLSGLSIAGMPGHGAKL